MRAYALSRSETLKGVEVIRHSSAHLLAQAVKLLYPRAQVTIGPVIDDGFYYDFAFERAFTPEDLEVIEAKMVELSAEDLPVSREVMEREDAISFFRDIGEAYKAELIAAIPEGETLTLYTQGDFTDLCRGPHVPSTDISMRSNSPRWRVLIGAVTRATKC